MKMIDYTCLSLYRDIYMKIRESGLLFAWNQIRGSNWKFDIHVRSWGDNNLGAGNRTRSAGFVWKDTVGTCVDFIKRVKWFLPSWQKAHVVWANIIISRFPCLTADFFLLQSMHFGLNERVLMPNKALLWFYMLPIWLCNQILIKPVIVAVVKL